MDHEKNLNGEKRFLYFAYGSNLHKNQMKSRCPDSIPLCSAILSGWKLVERFYADIERSEQDSVNGALYLISEKDLEPLDHYEGYPESYLRESVQVKSSDGTVYQAMVYRMTDEYKRKMAHRKYTARYRAICSMGADMWDLPNAFVQP